MDKVSVIMPCYNDGKYIREAIESVKNQTYPNIEIMVIDDGSEDNETCQILNGLSEDVCLLRSEHLRPAGARNLGISKATGKYILPLDSDDKIDATYIEKCVNILNDNEKIGAVYCYADLFGEKCGRWRLPKYSFKNMLVDNVVFVTAMFRKEDWEKVGGFDTAMDSGMEDYAFWISILALGKEIYQIPEILFHYRIKKTSRTTEFLKDIEKTKDMYRRIYYKHQDFYKEHAEEYAMALRDTLIEQIFLRRKYDYLAEKLWFFKKLPIIRNFINR